MNEKLKYLWRSLKHQFDRNDCPYCKHSEYKVIHRKYVITRLVQCLNCNLLFRLPVDPEFFNEKFYQEKYSQDDGITTHMPEKMELNEMIIHEFKAEGKGIDSIIKVFHALFKELNNLTVCDYGSSWGYISYQMMQRGMNVRSYEISKPRAAFGNRMLGLNIKTKIDKIESDSRIFFSSHVIEHVPSISLLIEHAHQLTLNQDDVFFIAYSPNGSFARLEKEPLEYHKNWGMVHPNFLSDLFYQSIFSEQPYFIDSFPYDFESLMLWDKKSQIVGNMEGHELLIIVRLKYKLSEPIRISNLN